MKLFIVGSDKVYAIENFYVKYLREVGIDIFHFPAQSIFYDHYQKNITNKIIYKLGISGILKQINKQFKKQVAQYKPDVIWVFKGMEIFPESLQWAKEQKIKLVNYNGDNPFLFSGKGSGNKNVTNAISLYDLHLTYNRAVKEEMEKEYHIKTEILPFGFDIEETIYDECKKEQEINKVCFLGNPDKHRGFFLQKLAEKGVQIDLYGNDWDKFVQHPNVQTFTPVYADDCWLVLRKYRVQLNLMRPHNPDTHNMRTFEVPAVGGIQLAPYTPDHEIYFTPEKEIFLYTDMDNCVQQINKIISFTTSQTNLIRQSARARSIDAGYSYAERAKQAISIIKSIIE